MSSRITTLGLASALAFAASGCGVSSWVTAPESKYPISMSNGVRDQNGELAKKENKQEVGTYEKDYLACSMLWRIISFTGDKDLSDDINQHVQKAGGNAVTNLSVESSGTVWTMLTLLGIFPDCAHVKVTGKIVKVTAPAPAPVAPAPATPPVAPAPVPAAPVPPPPSPAAAAPSPASAPVAVR